MAVHGSSHVLICGKDNYQHIWDFNLVPPRLRWEASRDSSPGGPESFQLIGELYMFVVVLGIVHLAVMCNLLILFFHILVDSSMPISTGTMDYRQSIHTWLIFSKLRQARVLVLCFTIHTISYWEIKVHQPNSGIQTRSRPSRRAAQIHPTDQVSLKAWKLSRGEPFVDAVISSSHRPDDTHAAWWHHRPSKNALPFTPVVWVVFCVLLTGCRFIIGVDW